MWVRKRLDIGWSDLWCAGWYCLTRFDSPRETARVEQFWSSSGDSFACLSVRTGFDLLLRALDFPRGSEILVSALTIRDMPRIIEEHGLVPIPVDVERSTLAPAQESLERAVSPRTKAILVAHLFGSRMPLEAIFAFARRHKLLVFEDCAQAYEGPGFRGHPESEVSLFSFGTIKTGTALGGAILRIGNPKLLNRMREIEAQFPIQSRLAFARRVLKYAALKFLSAPLPYGVLVALCHGLGIDHDRLMNRAVRGFSGAGFWRWIRRRPAAPLMALLLRRLRTFDARTIRDRTKLGETLQQQLSHDTVNPGAAAFPHSFWVFPVLDSQPGVLISALGRIGFDATQGESLAVVPSPAGRSDLNAENATAMLHGIVYLPCYPEMPSGELARMAELVKKHCRREMPILEEPATA